MTVLQEIIADLEAEKDLLNDIQKDKYSSIVDGKISQICSAIIRLKHNLPAEEQQIRDAWINGNTTAWEERGEKKPTLETYINNLKTKP